MYRNKKIKVKKHPRTLKNGKKVWVKSHTREIKVKKREHPRVIYPTDKQQTLFSDPRYKKYNQIVSFESEWEAVRSANKLKKEFEESKTRSKKLRVARVTQYSANRARASARRGNLSKSEKKKMKAVSKAYGKMAVRMWKQYRKL